MKHYEVAIIGGGSGGFAAARSVAAGGKKAVVIEGGPDVGGLCILRGCMPTKAMLYAAEVKHLAETASVWGVDAGPVRYDFEKVMARKNALIREFAGYRVEQLNSGTFDFIRSRARFLDANTLALDEGETIHAQQIVIATGSTVAVPPIADLASVGYLDSDQAMTLTRLPESIIVLGGGAVALEFAQFFSRFGVHVTLIQRSSQVLKEFDADAADAVVSTFRREGMDVYTGTRIIGATREGDEKTITFEQDGKEIRVQAEEIFFALGRTPNTAGLDLAKAGVAVTGARITTNDRMQTSVPHIYAVGDCTGPHEIVHIAIQQGEITAHNILQPTKPRSIDYRLLISIVFTEPQAAMVGFSERQAKAAGRSVAASSYPFNDHGKSMIMNVQEGFVKLVADTDTGEILGGACVGPVGGELIHEIVVAMAKRMTAKELAETPHYHPTLAEIWTYPAEELAETANLR